MSRFVVIISLLVGTVTGCDVFFPSGSRSASLTGLGADGGVCEKDEQTIKNVMLAPPPCNATNPCPCGTFCSSQTGGNCVADCVDDTWCAPGHVCSGYGQCLAATDGGADGGGSGPNVDPACPRNEALLDTLEVMQRPCQFDDMCPFGLYCDHVKERCFSACRSDAPCAAMNSPGHTFVCGCLGKCAEVSAPRVQSSQSLPALEVTPKQFVLDRPASITSPNWGDTTSRRVRLVVVAPFVTTSGMAITGPPATIQANPGPGLMVQCPGGGLSAMPCSVAIAPATFTTENGSYRSAPIDLVIAPSTAAPTATRWDLRLSSNDLSNTPMVVSVAYAGAVDTRGAPNYVNPTNDPSYRGQGIVELTTPTGATLTVPVKARWSGGSLVLFDETRQLSPSGKLPLTIPNGLSDYSVYIDTSLDNDPALQPSFVGRILQKIAFFTVERETQTGIVSGTFQRAIYVGDPQVDPPGDFPTNPLNPIGAGKFTLLPIANSSDFCDAPTDCTSPGRVCDKGFCAAAPKHQVLSQTQNGATYFVHKRMASWASFYHPQPTYHPIAGTLGIYLPNSYYLSYEIANFHLRGPLPTISGEPAADLYSSLYNSDVVFGVQPKAIPLLTQHDGPFPPSGPPSASELLSACLTDLHRDPVGTRLGIGTPEVFDTPASCLSIGRVALAMCDPGVFQRMLQGWLQVHSFVAREGLEEHRLQQAAGLGLSDSTTISAPALQTLLETTESGLGLLLDLTTYNSGPYSTFGQQGEIWGFADYRSDNLYGRFCNADTDCYAGPQRTMYCDASQNSCRLLGLKDVPQHEQPVGVPPVILETATSYLKVLEAYLGKVARESYGQPGDANPSSARAAALARFGSGMRLVLAAEQAAVGINTKAGSCFAFTPDSCPAIQQRFLAARDELNAVRPRVVAQAEAIRTARNPFNIPEDDVPLFFGDPSGKNSQYFASSDYLINGWAVPAVAQAQSYLDAARSSWIAKLQAKVQDELNLHNREQEINQLMSKYGAPVLAACGNLQVPDGTGLRLLDSAEVIPYYADGSKVFSNDTCFLDAACIGQNGLDGREAVRTEIEDAFIVAGDGTFKAGDDPSVLHFPPAFGSVASQADLFARDELCKISNLEYMLPHDPFLQQLRAMCPGDVHANIPMGVGKCYVEKRSDGNLYIFSPIAHTMPLAALFGPIHRSDVGPGRFYEFAPSPPSAIGDLVFGAGPDDNNIYGYRDFRTDKSYVGYVQIDYEFNGLSTQICSNGKDGRLKHDYPRPGKANLTATCYKGQLGVTFHEIEGDKVRLERAETVLDNGTKNLDEQHTACLVIDAHSATINNHVYNYQEMKNDYLVVSSIANGVSAGLKGGVSGILMSDLGAIGNWLADENDRIQELEKSFDRKEKAMECWNNFRAQRRALATAMEDIDIALKDLASKATTFRDLQAQNILNLQEGKAVLERELASPVSSLGHHFWVDEKVEQFKKEFEWARRLAFIGMRAVEYEFQQSLPFRSQIVSATTPAQLQDAMIGLQQEQAARTINRRRPEEASVVLSLRDDVLVVADRSEDPAGERNWTPAERFESRLWDDRYAVRDSNGDYLGQGIPFTLGPTGVLETRCGERLWRATATLQGDGIETSAPGASVLLLKRNTFSSQYCQGKSPPRTTPAGTIVPGPEMQVGVIHTSAQLFKPGANVDLSDANQFTAALLYPWFNVRRTDFYKASYRDGASEELAGRGLYGDYVLLFPKQLLEEGFTLDRVEDVLLRLDYLSVDNLSQ